MAMNVSNTGQNQERGQVAAKSAPARGNDPGLSQLEVFRRLPDSSFRTSPTGLKIATLKEGQGTPLSKGMKVKVQYTGWLEDGTRFDSSLERGSPFEFTLGAGRVIKGWEEGLAGIKPGERRQLIIPAALAYGDRQVNQIPPGSTLVFNVEAVAVEAPPANPKGTMTVVA